MKKAFQVACLVVAVLLAVEPSLAARACGEQRVCGPRECSGCCRQMEGVASQAKAMQEPDRQGSIGCVQALGCFAAIQSQPRAAFTVGRVERPAQQDVFEPAPPRVFRAGRTERSWEAQPRARYLLFQVFRI
jgi:hypothetical protein